MISGFIVYEQRRIMSLLEINKKCALAKKNWSKVKEFMKMPFIYKPIIFIFLVVIAPGVDDSMFYYESNVLVFTTD